MGFLVVIRLKTLYVPNTAGALVHFNCHNQELVPFGPAGVRTFIEALLIAGASAEDALAASFCLCRCD